jgi:hypothetical protein
MGIVAGSRAGEAVAARRMTATVRRFRRVNPHDNYEIMFQPEQPFLQVRPPLKASQLLISGVRVPGGAPPTASAQLSGPMKPLLGGASRVIPARSKITPDSACRSSGIFTRHPPRYELRPRGHGLSERLQRHIRALDTQRNRSRYPSTLQRPAQPGRRLLYAAVAPIGGHPSAAQGWKQWIA